MKTMILQAKVGLFTDTELSRNLLLRRYLPSVLSALQM